jgi:hypothetical protein
MIYLKVKEDQQVVLGNRKCTPGEGKVETNYRTLFFGRLPEGCHFINFLMVGQKLLFPPRTIFGT